MIRKLKTFLLRTRNILFHGGYIPTEYYVFDNRKLVYVSIPKVACTSLKTAVMPGSDNLSDTRNEYMTIHAQASQYCRSRLPRHSQDYFKFAFVRNPFDRLVSCYEDKVRTPVQHNGKYYFSSQYNESLIRRLYGSQFHPEMSFEEFVKLVSRIPDILSDGHFKSQYSVLYTRKKPAVDYVGKFENLCKDWNYIAERHGLSELKQRNTSSRSDWTSYYLTRETIEMVASRYKNDITHFGYMDAYTTLIKSLETAQDSGQTG